MGVIEKQSVVACVMGDDKFQLLQEVLECSRFFADIEEHLTGSGKDRTRSRIAIKPNFMVFLSSKDPSSHTDPELVDFRVKRLLDRGFNQIFVVELQNVPGKWYHNREVLNV